MKGSEYCISLVESVKRKNERNDKEKWKEKGKLNYTGFNSTGTYKSSDRTLSGFVTKTVLSKQNSNKREKQVVEVKGKKKDYLWVGVNTVNTGKVDGME